MTTSLTELRVEPAPVCEICGARVDARARVLRGLLEDQLGPDYLSKPLATMAETAAVLGVPVSSMYDLIHAGFPHMRVGTKIVIPPAMLVRHLLGDGVSR